jgi:hypothetical protein
LIILKSSLAGFPVPGSRRYHPVKRFLNNLGIALPDAPMDFAGLDELSVPAFRVIKSRAVLGTTEGRAEIILAVYRAPERPSDNAMGGFLRRISQSGKSRHLFSASGWLRYTYPSNEAI